MLGLAACAKPGRPMPTPASTRELRLSFGQTGAESPRYDRASYVVSTRNYVLRAKRTVAQVSADTLSEKKVG
jgi:hypothetical protein